MKKDSTKSKASRLDEPREEYDFRTGIRGKHHKAYRQGHSVVIHKMTQPNHFFGEGVFEWQFPAKNKAALQTVSGILSYKHAKETTTSTHIGGR